MRFSFRVAYGCFLLFVFLFAEKPRSFSSALGTGADAGSAGPGPASRRAALLAKLPPGAILVLRAAPVPALEVDPVYRPDSDFWYLTGFNEPESIAIVRPGASAGKRYTLFVRPRNFQEEQWTGWRAGPDGARAAFGADDALDVDTFWKALPDLLRGASSLYTLDGHDREFREKLLAAWAKRTEGAREPLPVVDAGPLVHQMRLVKDAGEIALMRRAAVLSAEAHVLAMKEAKAGAIENALLGVMVGHCLKSGAARMAYPPIVASGPNGVVLHYEKNDRKMGAGDMIVNDTACEFGMYAADVTRSYPAGGHFSSEERALYEIVLAAQKAGIARGVVGAEFHAMYDATVDVVVDGLLRLGIMKGSKADVVKSRSYKAFYPHGSSHWLGLNVHDVGSYETANPAGDRWERYATAMTKLAPGMVFTVEPGIYIPDKSEGVDPKWWNIGVRIEDDILVTATGPDCLSCGAPREIAEIERAIAGK